MKGSSFLHTLGLEKKGDQSYEGVSTVKKVLLAQLIPCTQCQGTKQDVWKKHYISGLISGTPLCYVNSVLAFCFSKFVWMSASCSCSRCIKVIRDINPLPFRFVKCTNIFFALWYYSEGSCYNSLKTACQKKLWRNYMQVICVIGCSVTHTLTQILLSGSILLLTWGTMEATEGESFDHLACLPVQTFSKVYFKIFHSVFSQKQF